RGSFATPPPDPLPEAERGEEQLPLSASGRGSGGGVPAGAPTKRAARPRVPRLAVTFGRQAGRASARRAQLEVVLTLLPTYWKVLEALEPRALMAAMQTTMINASITAYSTAVGPSSDTRKLWTFPNHCFMTIPLLTPYRGREGPVGLAPRLL